MAEPSIPKAALWYAQHMSWRVLALHGIVDGRCACGAPRCNAPGKRPWDAGWTTLASSSPRVVAHLFSRHEHANVGIATGAGSGLVVLDIDPQHGGEDTLQSLVAEHGELPHTLEVLTGGGGRHLYFRHPGGFVKTTAGMLGPGLDVRADGGQVVAPPSLHRSGRRYTWELSSRPWEVELAAMPPWLELLVKGSGAVPQASRSPEQWMELVSDGATEGARNSTLAALAGHLLRLRFLRPAIAAELLHCWNEARCRPPLPHGEVQKVVDSIANAEFRKRLRGRT